MLTPSCEAYFNQPPLLNFAEHKEKANCSGKRDRTAFLGRGDLDERSLISDYRFLEEVKLADEVAKRSRPPAPKLELPSFLQSLIHHSHCRGVQLHILPPGMERRRINSTRYDARQRVLNWRVEWQFPAASCVTSNSRVSEHAMLRDILGAHLTPPPGASLKSQELQRYQLSGGIGALVVAMRKERTPANSPLYYKLDLDKTLGNTLRGKVVVEFPVFLILLPDEAGGYTFTENEDGEGARNVSDPPDNV